MHKPLLHAHLSISKPQISLGAILSARQHTRDAYISISEHGPYACMRMQMQAAPEHSHLSSCIYVPRARTSSPDRSHAPCLAAKQGFSNRYPNWLYSLRSLPYPTHIRRKQTVAPNNGLIMFVLARATGAESPLLPMDLQWARADD